MRTFRTLLALLLLLGIDFGTSNSQPHTLSFHAHASLSAFHNDFGLDYHLGFGASIGYGLSERAETGLIGTWSTATRKFDLVGSTGNLDVRIAQYQGKLTYTVQSIFGIADVCPSASIGIIRLTTQSQTVQLGAIGNIRIPARTEDHFIYSGGIRLSRAIAPRLAIEVEPQVSLVSTSSLRANYSLTGGISLGIL